MWVRRSLPHGEHRCNAGVHSVEQGGPLIASTGGYHRGDPVVQLGPTRRVVLVGERLVAGQAQAFEQLRIELGLDRGDCQPATIGAFVHVVERCTRVQQVRAALDAPESRRPGAEQRGHEKCRAVDHGGIDDLPLPRHRALDESGEHTHGKEHAAATEVGHQVERRSGRLAAASDMGEHSRQRQVRQVMARTRSERSFLTPAGHAAVDQPRVR